jgi:magnesium chelatase family protein
MVVSVRSLGLCGLSGYEVRAECFLSGGLPAFDIVGLPDAAVREARERVRAAVKNCGAKFPVSRITVNLAPAGQKKEGTVYDLPILVGLLAAEGELPPLPPDAAFLGELSLSGAVRGVSGVLPMALAAPRCGIRTLFVPAENAAEATLAGGTAVFGVPDVAALVRHLRGEALLSPAPAWTPEPSAAALPDFRDVMGQEHVKRALEVAAAGGHNVLLIGSPGAGKSMLARRLPSILPDMTAEESLESSAVWSVAGLLDPGSPLLTRRPFRAPHHTASAAALSGGGPALRPGEMSLAHNGVLFLDELPEFHRDVLEAMRQPLEDGEVTVARAGGTLRLPARFQLVCAMNPCRCGWRGHPSGRCSCSDRDVEKYVEKISGPLLDRIDLHITVPSVEYEALRRRTVPESSA